MKNDLPDAASLEALLQLQREAHARAPYPSWETRAAHLKALRTMLLENGDALAQALHADFGQRAKAEIVLSELWLAKSEIDSALKHGKRWMKPQRRPTGMWLRPATAKVIPQPLGVVGIVAPWNYPILLAVGPLICALAAGNRALIKMSEFVPRTAELTKQLLERTFAREQVAVVTGDASVGAAFCALPFDHLTFTGSTTVGREVMRAAALNLTPVTLELGGKSPAIIGPDARFDAAVDSIVAGKTLNAGQTCIAPDYVLLPRGTEQAFIERARSRVARLYPDFAHNRDYTTLISERHFDRMRKLADEALAAGAMLHSLTDCTPDAVRKYFPPCVLTNAPAASALMQEEIFGPLLPLVPYDTLDDALRYVNARPRPLALYLFDEARPTIERVLRETVSGGAAVNETLLQIACEGLPFGGVGASGMGAYHGYDGFATFSNMKPVLVQPRFNARALLLPPYGRRFYAVMRLMMKL
ncbi:MAG: coniferyl aldehyde dehydrogenase [Trinickia sp.]|uniref:coniferyl aldehyde dehydrogenase n=1 Tax=Trinickia sp. TaxID=2571163 RepID=UPI003F7DCAA9